MLKALLALIGSILRSSTLVEVVAVGCIAYGLYLAYGSAAAWVAVGVGGLLHVLDLDSR